MRGALGVGAVAAVVLSLACGAAGAVPRSGAATDSASHRLCTIRGTAGDDRLVGTSGPDVICGLAGDDVIIGMGGNDVLVGGPGRDRMRGGPGRDILFGGAGDDELRGGSGDDYLDGGPGKNKLFGGPGDDEVAATFDGSEQKIIANMTVYKFGPSPLKMIYAGGACTRDEVNPTIALVDLGRDYGTRGEWHDTLFTAKVGGLIDSCGRERASAAYKLVTGDGREWCTVWFVAKEPGRSEFDVHGEGSCYTHLEDRSDWGLMFSIYAT